MFKSTRAQLPAIAIATLALFVALGGPASAARLINGNEIKKNTVTTKQVKNESLTGADVKNGTLTGTDVKDGTLGAADVTNESLTGADVKNGTLTGADVKDGTLTAADVQAGQLVQTIVTRRVVASSGPSRAAALAGATPVVLFKRGPLSVVARCFTDTEEDVTHYQINLQTAVDGAVFSSREDYLTGGATDAFLNVNSDLSASVIEAGEAEADSADSSAEDSSDFVAFAPGGTSLRGFTGGAVKNGTLSGGNGVYGAGDVCLFNGLVAAS